MRLRPEQLGVHLSKSLASIYLVCGDEPLLHQEATDAIRKAARAQGYTERECLTVESGFDWNSLSYSADSLSLFARQRLLELRLGNTKPGDAGGKALRAYAKRPAEDAILLISAGKLDANTQKTRWFMELEATGVVVQIWPLEARHLPAWVQRRMLDRGLQPTSEAVALLAERVEGNLLAAAQEIEKLQVLFGSGAVNVEQLLAVIGDSARYSIYDLVDAALASKTERVVRILHGLRAEGVEPVLTSWALQREIRLLASLRFTIDQGLPMESVLTQNKVWERRKPLLRSALKRLSTKDCRNLLQACARLDRCIKGVEQGDPWVELLDLSLRLAGTFLLAASK